MNCFILLHFGKKVKYLHKKNIYSSEIKKRLKIQFYIKKSVNNFKISMQQKPSYERNLKIFHQFDFVEIYE